MHIHISADLRLGIVGTSEHTVTDILYALGAGIVGVDRQRIAAVGDLAGCDLIPVLGVFAQRFQHIL